MKEHTIPIRSDVPTSDTWDLTSLFPADDAWEDTLQTFSASISDAEQFSGTLGSSAEQLLRALTWYMEHSEIAERLQNYAFLQFSVDGSEGKYQRNMGMVRQALADFSAATSFFAPEIQEMNETLLRNWMQDERFADYRIMLEKQLRYKPHILGTAEEKILAQMGLFTSTPRSAFQDLTNIDFDFGTIDNQPLTQSTFSSFLIREDREIRKRAYLQFYDTYDKHKHTLATLYGGQVKQDVFDAKVRNFPGAREAALFADNVPIAVYDNLISTIHEAFPILHRYYHLRSSLLKIKKLAHYDMYVPLISGIQVITPYEEAVTLVCNALAPLGDEYVTQLKKGLTTERWVDRYENRGKRSGAFSSGSYRANPYIMLNYKQDVLRDVFTLAHEGGHSMHTYYSAKNNPYPHYDYTIFEAEVASTFNEQLLASYLLEHAQSKEMKAYILAKQIDDIIATLFRQTMFAEYEMLVHQQVEQGEPTTIESLRETYGNLLSSYFGPSVEFEAVSNLEGLRIPHFYNAFYVYKYATGISAAISLSEKVLKGADTQRIEYLNFLKTGGSAYPIDSLKAAGVDMSTPQPIRSATAVFASLLDEFESLIN